MMDKIAGWKLQFLLAELCRQDEELAIMEFLMRVCVEPKPAWVKNGAAILRMFDAHLFEMDKSADDDYYFLP